MLWSYSLNLIEICSQLESQKDQPSVHYLELYFGQEPYLESVRDCVHVQYMTVDLKKLQHHICLRDCIQ